MKIFGYILPVCLEAQWTDFHEILHRPSRKGQRWQILVIGYGVWILRGGEIMPFPIDSPVAVNTRLALRSNSAASDISLISSIAVNGFASAVLFVTNGAQTSTLKVKRVNFCLTFSPGYELYRLHQ